MSDQEKNQETTISPQPDAENKKKGTKPAQGELTDQELDKVSGGIQIDSIVIQGGLRQG
jgi:hypothetical protein